MRKFIPIMVCLFLAVIMAGNCQEVLIPLPQGEGYVIKKDAPSANARWEIKIVGQGGFPASERIIISPESFYKRNIPPEEAAPEAGAAPAQAPGYRAAPMGGRGGAPTGYGEPAGMGGPMRGQAAPVAPDTRSYPIRRLIKPETPEDGKAQADAFLEAYNQVLEVTPPDEPIEFIIERAAWQYWFNQMDLWQQYVQKEVFLKPAAAPKMNNLDFSNRDALNNAIAGLANEINDEAKIINAQVHRRNLEFIYRLDFRENQRSDYKQWLEDQKDLVIEFTHNWARKEEGQELNIDGTVYLLSDEPMERVPRNTVNLVTENLTPYDLLNADGTLKKPLD